MTVECIPETIEAAIREVCEQVHEGLLTIYHEMVGEGDQDLQWVESSIRKLMQDSGLASLQTIVGDYDRHHAKGAQPCPHCEQPRQWKRYEPRTCLSTQGRFPIERAYYHCPDCHAGWCPLDERLGLGRSELSPVAEQIASYAGALMPFPTAADFLSRSQLLSLSHDSVNRATQRVGEQLRQAQSDRIEMIQAGRVEVPDPPDEVPDTAYWSADGVRFLTTDGRGRELKVAVLYETEGIKDSDTLSEPKTCRPDYVVSSLPPDQFARLVDDCAHQRGLHQARHKVVVQDGGVWLWRHIAPLAGAYRVEILDFYHAAGYVTDAIAALVSRQEQAFWNHLLLEHLKHENEGCQHLIQVLTELASHRSTIPTAVAKALNYFTNYSDRMNYAAYARQHFQIGSGTVESAANRVVSDRLKQAGMRWNPDHAEAVAQVRAAIFSQHQWTTFWQTYRPAKRSYQRQHQQSHHNAA